MSDKVYLGNSEWAQRVQLSGSKVNQKKVVTLATALAITSTTGLFFDGIGWHASNTGEIIDWNNYNRHELLILNSHDQPIKLGLLSKLRGGASGWDHLKMGVAKTTTIMTIPANSGFEPIKLSKDDLKALDGIQSDPVSMYLKADIAPISGNITIKVTMWSE